MDTARDTQDYSPRGTDHVRPARARRRSTAGRYWRLALIVVAIAVAILVVSATRARAQPAGSAAAGPVRLGISGGVAVPVGDFKAD